MGQRFVMWGRRHSVNRVVRPGDWVGLGSPTPAVVPFAEEARVEPAGVVADEAPIIEREAGAARPGTLGVELEHAGRAVLELKPHRERGRPRKAVPK